MDFRSKKNPIFQFVSLPYAFSGLMWMGPRLVTDHPEIESINFTFPKMKKRVGRIKKGWKRGTDSRFESFWILSNSFELKTKQIEVEIIVFSGISRIFFQGSQNWPFRLENMVENLTVIKKIMYCHTENR